MSALAAPALAFANETCDRPALIEATSRYFAAQSLGQIQYFKTLSTNATYTENGVATDIKTGILSQPLKIDFTRSIHDTTTCSTFTELIITDPKHPYVIGTQLSFVNGTTIVKIETLVSDAGDWLFNAQHTLHYALLENWEPIVLEKQNTRQAIQAAADSYLDLFKKGNGSVAVPWHENCRRLEGGLYTAPGDTCNDGVPSGVDLVNRRYVIDETLGVVDVFLTFGAGGLPDSHEFRIEDGKIRYVHTITVCSEANCGFGDLPSILGEDIGF
ncbi:hypothetical protein B0T17DRAFT_482298 [Bombardia bombarda]|uniref:DUF8021 domain-containing protein n=1 Tax=Bombardia bombarda TaxID=252184 RepID=A0AA39XJ60_9PEZI|nr:hypothetical protein B0T17DRAFT_482298 [Bombardia bombarda]